MPFNVFWERQTGPAEGQEVIQHLRLSKCQCGGAILIVALRYQPACAAKENISVLFEEIL